MKHTLLVALALVIVSGCTTYRLGSTLPPNIRTVYVPTADNATTEPLIEIDVTRAVLQALQQDGSLKIVASADDADAVLAVTVTRFDLEPLAFDADRRSAANEYRLVLQADATLTESRTGKVIAKQEKIRGDSTFEITGDFTSSKTTAFPAAAKDLAHRIVAAIVEAW